MNQQVQTIPIVIGVTGHRSIREEDVPALLAAVKEELTALRDRCPHADLSVLRGASAADTLRGLCPSDETLRSVYRLLIGGRSFPSPEALAEAAGLPLPQILIALQAFEDTSLIHLSWRPFTVSPVLPARKCSITDSPVIRYLRENE